MTPPDRDDVWQRRRRLGDALGRWAGAPVAARRRDGRRAPRRHVPIESPRQTRSSTAHPARVRRAGAWLPGRRHWWNGSGDGDRLREDADGRDRWWSRVGGHGWGRLGFWCRGRRDRGAATILVLAIGLVLAGAGLAGAAVGSARVGRHRAQVAADLGALAGAAHAIEGQEVACAAASGLVAANAGRMSSCEVQGLEIVVHVEVPLISLPGPSRHARAVARAGPVYAL